MYFHWQLFINKTGPHLSIIIKLLIMGLLASASVTKAPFVSSNIQCCQFGGPTDATEALVSNKSLVVIFSWFNICICKWALRLVMEEMMHTSSTWSLDTLGRSAAMPLLMFSTLAHQAIGCNGHRSASVIVTHSQFGCRMIFMFDEDVTDMAKIIPNDMSHNLV